jgi:hypothetical protein
MLNGPAEQWLFDNRIGKGKRRLAGFSKNISMIKERAAAIHTKHSQHSAETYLRYFVNPVEGDAP